MCRDQIYELSSNYKGIASNKTRFNSSLHFSRCSGMQSLNVLLWLLNK